jgi:hypothetical protein
MKCALARLSLLVFLTFVLGSDAIRAQESSTKAAQTATEAWLSLIDNENYAASWDAAASFFRARITPEQWQTAAQRARSPFGQLKSRTPTSAKATTTLPGAPDGQYVVFQFTTSFERKAAALESVTAIRETDGTWRVGGYFVK